MAKVELVEQEGQFLARVWRLFLDIVVEAPRQFSDELRYAVRRVLRLP